MARQMLKDSDKQFMQLMRIALGNADRFDVSPTEKEWEDMLLMSAKQSVVGVAFTGVERLPKDQMPPLDVIMDWSAVVEHIKRENLNLNEVCVKVCSIFKQEKINACILKGQGMGALYDDPLRRSPGDIDVWMEGGKDKVVEYIMKNFPNAKKPGPGGHHITALLKGSIDMEVHYRPAELFNPFHENAMNKWFKSIEFQQWGNMLATPCIAVPTKEFDLFFVLAHLFLHWTVDGCGLKQIVDYYYLLKAAYNNNREGMDNAYRKIVDLGLGNFAAAMMYVFNKYFGMEERMLLCPPDKVKGEILIADIMKIGTVSTATLINERNIVKFGRRWCRMWRIITLAPTEIPWLLPKNIISWVNRKIQKGE